MVKNDHHLPYRTIRVGRLGILLLLFFVYRPVAAQNYDLAEEETPYDTKRQVGLGFAMAESGSSFGTFIGWPLIPDFHIGIGFDVFLLRDSKQVDFYDYYSNMYYSINKQNNVYLFDLMMTVKKRMFRQDLSDDFRPFLSIAAGPIYGMNFPEASTNYSGYKKKDEYRWTFGGFIGAGIDFGVKSNHLVSLRAQYRIMPFSEKIGERSNQSMFELRVEIAQRF
jgi:hypothetical protein